jgi:hypothetical protein
MNRLALPSRREPAFALRAHVVAKNASDLLANTPTKEPDPFGRNLTPSQKHDDF